MKTMQTSAIRVAVMSALALACMSMWADWAVADEAAQGIFDVTLDEGFNCDLGGGGFVSHHTYDDKTFIIPLPSSDNFLTINFSAIGPVTVTGFVNCVFDEGGTFAVSGVNEAGDFQWTEMKGEYIDKVPGLAQGDPFPFVGTARCSTTRTDDFRTLCDNFELSFNGLGKALAPNPWYKYYAGDFTFRAAPRVPVDPGPKVDVQASVDGAGGAVPEVQISFQNGVVGAGTLRVATLADAHGEVPLGFDLPVRGTTEIDHGGGPVPFFAGGDERFIELSTDAALPGSPAIEVCLPMPAGPARPVRLLHGEGTSVADRQFVDRTSRLDPTTGQVCAKVKSFSKFAVVTSDVCGSGQSYWDGLLTVAGGLLGKRTVVVDGLTDCAQYPANLPRGLARYCVPDANPAVGQCGVAISLGVNRSGCNRSGLNSGWVAVNSYSGAITHGTYAQDLNASIGPLIATLFPPATEASVGPVLVSVPVDRKITTYKLRQQLTGWRPDISYTETDTDVVRIKCVDPGQF